MYKNCPKCGLSKPIESGFYKDSSRKDGKTPYCRDCHREYYKQSAPRLSVTRAKAYADNPTSAKIRALKRRCAKADEIKQHKRKAFASLPDSKKAERKTALTKWKIENRAKVAANCRTRQARKIKACPKWLTKEQLAAIADFYKAAESLRKLFDADVHVDHIVPLRGATVCGLHVPWNLQLLGANDNVKKSNNDWPGKP